ncbi:hypothetical protein [Burkholderia cenocepacia]|uniref:hypothetical protein n=1 Tax=Burkholderia cenocepacia TaxID=95486 RepID=UPI0007619703|nr:hypothetical protein [Burkholderia cenocepacia]
MKLRHIALVGLLASLAGIRVSPADTEGGVASVKEVKGSCFMRNGGHTAGHQLRVADNLSASDEVQCGPSGVAAVVYIGTGATVFLVGPWQPLGTTSDPQPTAASGAQPMLGRHAYLNRTDAEEVAARLPLERRIKELVSSPIVLDPIAVYEKLGDSKTIATFQTHDFPWHILEQSGQYLRVESDGVAGWVNACIAIVSSGVSGSFGFSHGGSSEPAADVDVHGDIQCKLP